MKQAIKKKVFTKPSTNDIRAKLGLKASKENMVVSSAEKPIEFITMPEAFSEATKLPGIPMGVTTIIHGHSNTGKSLLKNCLIASAQAKGVLVVLYETENNFSFPFAISCGMKATPEYGDVEVEDVDEETGEIVGTHIEKRLVDYETNNFIYYDSDILANQYGDIDHSTGKRGSKKRSVPVIEDIAYSMNEILDLQEQGEIQQPILFMWDSVGSIDCYKSYVSKSSNSMWNAASLSVAFNTLLNNRIPTSKKVSRPYTNSFVCVNKVWLDSMSSPMAAPSLQMKGGASLLYSARLTILLGGTIKAATKRLTATSKGETYTYGLTTKIKVVKNQLDAPYNLTYEGTFCCVPDGMIPEEKLDEYKKKNASVILAQLKKQLEEKGKDSNSITEDDIQYSEVEGDE